MNQDDLTKARRSTRLSISIPVIISGLDAQGNRFSETAHTVAVNKHGAKITTAHVLALGTEIEIENPPLGIVAKAHVVWLGENKPPRELHDVGIQLVEAKDVWGIAFPPSDWGLEAEDLKPATPVAEPDADGPPPAEPVTRLPSPAEEELAIQFLQEMQGAVDAHTREFQDRLKQLSQRLGMELESELRARAASAKTQEAGAWQNELAMLRESLSAAREEIRTLEAKVEELKSALSATAENPTPMQEARRQLAALTKSVVESMNRAAEAGLNEYRNLLRKENGESASRQRLPAKEDAPSPQVPVPRP